MICVWSFFGVFFSFDVVIDLLYQVPGSIIALLSVFYGSISVMSVAGNSLVIWIVATSRSMQSVINCFIANLALADIVIGLFAIPFQVRTNLLLRKTCGLFRGLVVCAMCFQSELDRLASSSCDMNFC